MTTKVFLADHLSASGHVVDAPQLATVIESRYSTDSLRQPTDIEKLYGMALFYGVLESMGIKPASVDFAQT